jgi:hypothetical protein
VTAGVVAVEVPQAIPVQHTEKRAKTQPRPNLRAILGEMDVDNELDVPTFIRRHNTAQT